MDDREEDVGNNNKSHLEGRGGGEFSLVSDTVEVPAKFLKESWLTHLSDTQEGS